MHNEQAIGPIVAAAIVVAGGSGSRMGDGGEPKQFRALGGRPVLLWSVDALLRCSEIGPVIVVVPAGHEQHATTLLPRNTRLTVVTGGASRTESVRNGLRALGSAAPPKVLIHDAARPGLTVSVVRDLLAALEDAGAAAPALPVADALKSASGDGAYSTVSRDGLYQVQTPQAFRTPLIVQAYAAATGDAVDDLALVESHGARIVLTPGQTSLMKVTRAEDMAVVEKLIAAPALRIGSGFDVHAFEPGDGVILCGVKIPYTKKLEGHSDADAGWHALTDAILGALALGDIGDHFPPSDPQWKGAASVVFLKHAVKLAQDRGYRIVNADITILAERPKVSPHREAMRSATAEALGLPMDAVSIKATTTEKLGFVGREEGIAAQANVLLAG
jgi:2-C-methyl-D-erythritol 4-phosphate cytidylyltransferase/2-C-methyl-D-erythritol 2,4-cyclodiphosphate synthase